LIVEPHTAGDPCREDYYWTDLCQTQIADQLTAMGTSVCSSTAKHLLDDFNFSKRKMLKNLPGGEVADRNTQFEHIQRLRKRYQRQGNPVFSMDTKKKEHLGLLYRDGRVYCQQPFEAFDHDFPSWATGKIIPHGIWDPFRNHGHLNLGLSHDTAQFACESFRWFWKRIGRIYYPDASSILLLCDAGGSNNCRHYIFKQELQRLVNEIGVEIRVAHYPTYCSKFNPIERRFFCHVTRACQGVLFDTLDKVVNMMRKTATRTGLSTTVRVMRKAYETGRHATEEFRQNMKFKLDQVLPRWNYTAQVQVD